MHTQEKKNVRFGIIGVGNMGSAHARCIAGGEIAGAVLSALCDTDANRRDALRALYPNVPVFHTHRELLDSGLVDAIIVATPHAAHPPIAIDAFRKGLHVLVEKPAGIETKSVLEMNEVAKESGRIFSIMFNQRANRLFRRAREILRSGELGEFRRSIWIITNWYRKQTYYDSGIWRGTWAGEGGGVLINQAPHNLDLWQWICGMPKTVYAQCYVGLHHDVEVEDDATLMVEYEGGATGLFVTSTGDYPGTNRLEITGSRGKLLLENGKLTLTHLSMDERELRMTGKHIYPEAEITEILDEPYCGHAEILANFTDAILHGTPLLAPGDEGICELTLSNAAYLSAWTGEKIELPLDREHFLVELEKRRATSHFKSEAAEEAKTGEYKSRWNTNW